MAIVLPKFSRRRSSPGLAAEAQPAVNVALCREEGIYEAGSPLVAKWRIRRVALDNIQSIEVSVMWHTEGKGDEDLHVHHFQRLCESQIRRAGLADEQSLACTLPPSPLSYQGRLISVRWCIRLRLYLAGGREIVAEQPFHLVAPGAHPVAAEAATQREWRAKWGQRSENPMATQTDPAAAATTPRRGSSEPARA